MKCPYAVPPKSLSFLLRQGHSCHSLVLDKNTDTSYYPSMIATSKITRKYQTTIPKAVVEQLGIKPADRLVYEIEDGGIRLRARTGRIVDLAGKFAHFSERPRRPHTVAEMDEAVAQGAAAAGLAGLKRRRHA